MHFVIAYYPTYQTPLIKHHLSNHPARLHRNKGFLSPITAALPSRLLELKRCFELITAHQVSINFRKPTASARSENNFQLRQKLIDERQKDRTGKLTFRLLFPGRMKRSVDQFTVIVAIIITCDIFANMYGNLMKYTFFPPSSFTRVFSIQSNFLFR